LSAAVDVVFVFRNKSNCKGVGQECPTHKGTKIKKDSPEPPRLSLKTLPVRRVT
jgi:hypothetical protein